MWDLNICYYHKSNHLNSRKLNYIYQVSEYLFLNQDSLLNLNLLNLDLSQVLTMTVQFLVTFSAFLFEDKNFVVFQMSEYFNRDLRTSNNRGSDGNFTTIIHQHYLVEIYIFTFFCFQTVNVERLIVLYFVLLSGDFNYCVHCFVFGDAKVVNYLNYQKISFTMFLDDLSDRHRRGSKAVQLNDKRQAVHGQKNPKKALQGGLSKLQRKQKGRYWIG